MAQWMSICLASTEHSVQGTWINNVIRAMLYDQHLGAQNITEL